MELHNEVLILERSFP
jgi:hypothetical protein